MEDTVQLLYDTFGPADFLGFTSFDLLSPNSKRNKTSKQEDDIQTDYDQQIVSTTKYDLCKDQSTPISPTVAAKVLPPAVSPVCSKAQEIKQKPSELLCNQDIMLSLITSKKELAKQVLCLHEIVTALKEEVAKLHSQKQSPSANEACKCTQSEPITQQQKSLSVDYLPEWPPRMDSRQKMLEPMNSTKPYNN